MKKRVLSLLLCLVMALSLIPSMAFAAEKTEISVIRATSDIMTPEYGATVKIPNFTITEGAGAHFATNNGGWFPGQLWNGAIFGAADYYYYTQIRIDGEDANYYKFSDSLKAYVNDVEWEVDSVRNYDGYSMAWAKSPATTTTEPVGMPFAVDVPSNYKVAAGGAGTLVSSLNFANCVSGGTKPYTYTKVSGPDWLTLSSGGVLSGTRPSTASEATSFVLHIADSKGASQDITVPVGAVNVRTEIAVIRATSDIMTPEYGAAVKIPNFTITEGNAAWFATGNGGWYPGQLWNGAIFGVADYYYYTQVRIDGTNGSLYKFSPALKAYVNDVEWEVDSVQNTDTYSMAWVKSPITTTAEPTETRTVAFNMNGRGTAIDAQTVEVGSKATKPADPAANGYTFGGWYTDSACTTAFDFNTPVANSIILYAKWTKNIEAVTGITITVPQPIAGKTRAEAAKIATVTSTPANAVVITDGDWWNTDGNYATTFEAGETYCYGLYINPKTSYKLEMSGDDYLGEIKVTNGSVGYTEANGKGGFFLSINVNCVETRTAINNIAITVDAPVVGKAVAESMFVPAVTTGPADAAEFDAAESKWADSNGNWFNGTFEAGKQYHYIVALKAKDGYRFPQSDEYYTGTVKVSGAGLYYPGANANGQYVYLDLLMTPTCTHINTEVKNAAPATCTATGYTGDTVCKDCGATVTAGTVIPLEDHSYVKTVKAPTYSAKGYTLHKCSACGDSYKDTYKDMKTLTQAKITSITNTSTGITVKWGKVTGTTHYQVYRRVGSGEWKLWKTTTSTSVSNSSLTNGTKYQYKVRAVVENSAGTVINKGEFSAIKTMYRLTRPTLASGTKNIATRKIVVKWNKNTKVTGYQVKYIKGTTTKTVTVKGASSLTKTLSSLTKGSTYKVSVRSYKTVSGTTYYSAYSAVKSVKVAK